MYTAKEWRTGVYVFLGGVALIGIYAVATHESTSQRETRLQGELQQDIVAARIEAQVSALRSCQGALRRASFDPEKATVPEVGMLNGGTDYRFLWTADSKQVRMRTALGLEKSADALCVVDQIDGRIKLLTLDGTQLVSPTGS